MTCHRAGHTPTSVGRHCTACKLPLALPPLLTCLLAPALPWACHTQNWPAQLQLCGNTCDGVQYNVSGPFYSPYNVTFDPVSSTYKAYYTFILEDAWQGTAFTNRLWICLYDNLQGDISKRSEATLTVYAPPPPSPPPSPPRPPPPSPPPTRQPPSALTRRRSAWETCSSHRGRSRSIRRRAI